MGLLGDIQDLVNEMNKGLLWGQDKGIDFGKYIVSPSGYDKPGKKAPKLKNPHKKPKKTTYSGNYTHRPGGRYGSGKLSSKRQSKANPRYKYDKQGRKYYKNKNGKWNLAKSYAGNRKPKGGRPAPGGGGGSGRPAPGGGGGGGHAGHNHGKGGGGRGGSSGFGLGKADKRAINAAVESILRQEIGPMDKERKRIKAQERAQLRQADRSKAGYDAAMSELRAKGLEDSQDMISLAANVNDHRPEQAEKNKDLIASLFGNQQTQADGVSEAMADGNQRAFASAMGLTGQSHAGYMDRSSEAAAAGHVERQDELRRDSRERRRELTDAINMVQGKRGQLRYEYERQALQDLLKQQAAAQAFGLQQDQFAHNVLMDNARLALSKQQAKGKRDYDFADIQSILYGTERDIKKTVSDADGNPKTVTETIRDGGAASKQEALQNLVAIGVPRKQAKKMVNEWARQQISGNTKQALESLKNMFAGFN